jgi:hypothetical protein
MEQDADGEIKITEAVNFMHSSGYKDASVEEVAAKYDEDENGLINLHEFTEIYRDLQVQCLQTLSSAQCCRCDAAGAAALPPAIATVRLYNNSVACGPCRCKNGSKSCCWRSRSRSS